jgi:hypothetical protein
VEEVVISIQGVIIGKDLPPFNKESKRLVCACQSHIVLELTFQSRNKAGFVRQAVTLCGLGAVGYQDTIDGILAIDSYIRRHLPESSVEPMTFISEYGNSGPTLDLANRYFTSRKLAPFEPAIPIDDTIDPHGNLGRLAGLDYVHTEENRVEYSELRRNADGANRYVNVSFYPVVNDLKQSSHSFSLISPAKFRVGDVVEAQFTVMVTSIASRSTHWKHKSCAVLRSLTMVNSSFTDVSVKMTITFFLC